MELFHTDFLGKIDTTSMYGAYYFISFIEKHSKWTTVHPMRHKSERVGKCKNLVSHEETFTGRILKTIRSDNGE